jgi:hypothetical protein
VVVGSPGGDQRRPPGVFASKLLEGRNGSTCLSVKFLGGVASLASGKGGGLSRVSLMSCTGRSKRIGGGPRPGRMNYCSLSHLCSAVTSWPMAFFVTISARLVGCWQDKLQ